jgi:Tfp pilus assembly protein PilZ
METPEPFSQQSDVTDRLLAIVRSLSETEQITLLRQLEQQRRKERRELPRKTCSLTVDYVSAGQARKDFIRNLSASGVFIETREAFTVGQTLTLTFSLPDVKIPLKFVGKIVRTTPQGIGVQFRWPC